MTDFPQVGEQFGAFLITREIGRGGMGVVFSAQQQPLNRPVALKVLDPRFTTDPSFAARFAREGELLATMNSPHVIQVYDHGRVGDCLYLAMQQVSGGDLSQFLDEHGPLTPALAADLTGQIASALADAHARGVIHRDIKPSNVLLAKTGHDLFAYLCDFGIAQSNQSGLTQVGMFPGSLPFTAPERHEGHPADERSDLYSLGCLLWTLLCGSAPYAGTDFQIAQQHFTAPVPQVPGRGPVATETNRLLARLLAKDPAQRPDSALDVVAALRALQRLAEAEASGPITSIHGVADGRDASGATPRRPAEPTQLSHRIQPAVALPTAGIPPNTEQVQLASAQTRPPGKHRLRTAVVTAAIVVVAAVVGGGGLWALTTLFSSASAPTASVAATSPTPSKTESGQPTSDSEPTRAPVRRKATEIRVGESPHGLAVNPGSRLAFVANYGDSSVFVVNLDSHTVVRKIDVGDKPQSVVVDAASGLLLVGCDGIPAVQIYDLQGYHLVGSVSTGKGPIRIAVHSAQKLAYVVAQGSSKMQVISLSSRKLIRTVDVGAHPRVIGVDEQDQMAYIGHWGGNKISVIDLNSQSKISQLRVGSNANSIEIAADARLAFVANYGQGAKGGGSVSVIDLDTRSVKKSINVDDGPSRLAVDESAGVVYLTCLRAAKVDVIDLSSLTVVDRFGAAHRPTGAGVDSSTGKLYVTSFDKHVVQVFAA